MVGIRTTELAAIFFATFENVRGTVIAYQYPTNYVSPSQFKEISNAVLPRAELAFHVITVEAFQHYVIGCPQRIEGVRYQRNTLQFNICLVIKPNPCHILDDITGWQFATDQSAGGLRLPIQLAYEALALKINRFFYTLEEDCAFLSECIDGSTGEWGDASMPCLDAIFQQLHTDGMCVYPFDNSGSLYLRFSPQKHGSIVDELPLDDEEIVSDTDDLPHDDTGDPNQIANEISVIREHQTRNSCAAFAAPQSFSDRLEDSVFVLVGPANSKMQQKTEAWVAEDCVSRRLLPHIDGTHNLLELSYLSHVDLSMTRMCVADLIQAGLIRALPVPTFLRPVDTSDSVPFPISNAGWLGLPRLSILLSDEELGSACLESVITDFPENFEQPNVRLNALMHIFRVYTILCGSPNFSLPHLISATPLIRFMDLPGQRNIKALGSSDSVNCGDGTTLCSTSAHLLSVNFLHLVQFGEVNGLIHRIQCYPISDGAECFESSDTATQDPHTMDSSNPSLLTIRTSTHPGHFSTLSPIHLGNLNPVLSAGELDEKTWNTIRSTLLDGLHSVDGVCSMLTQELCLFGVPEKLSPSDLVTRFSDNLMHRLHTKLPTRDSTEWSVKAADINGSSSCLTLPIGWAQPPPPPTISSRTKDPGFKLVSTSTDEPISASRTRPNPLTRSGHSIQRRMSFIPQGYTTGELRSLVERHVLEEKAHGSDRKTNRHNQFYCQAQHVSVPSLYMIWR